MILGLALAVARQSRGADAVWLVAADGVAKSGSKLVIDRTTGDYGAMAQHEASGGRFVRLTPAARLTFAPFSIDAPGYRMVWVRCFAIEKRLLTVSIDGHEVGTSNGAAGHAALAWQCLGSIDLHRGRHAVELNAAKGNRQAAYVDCVALVAGRDAIPVGRRGEMLVGRSVERIADRFADRDVQTVGRRWQITPPPGNDAAVDLLPKEDGGAIHIHNGAGQPFRLTSRQFLWLKPGDQLTVRLRVRKGTLCERLSIAVAGVGTFEPQLYRQFQDAECTWLVPAGISGPLIVELVGQGGGDTYISRLEAGRRDPPLSPYETGRFLPKPNVQREGRLFEIERYVVNREAICEEDRDNDGKWALCRLSRARNTPWFSRGTVLKSDTISADRSTPEEGCPPLHVRVGPLEPGRYQVYLSVPGRALALSLDGRHWQCLPGKELPNLGVVTLASREFEFWLDDRFVEPGNPGPTYVDFIRFLPIEDPAYTMADSPRPGKLDKGTQSRRSVALTVENATALRRNEPVCCGVPIPRGELASAEQTRLVDDQGHELPAHVASTGVWPDGSVKWLLVDFSADVPPRANRTFALEYGNNVRGRPPANGMRMEQSAGQTTIVMNAVRWSIDARRGGRVECRLPGVTEPVLTLADFAITGPQGQQWRSSRDSRARIEIEEASPLRAVLRVRGNLVDEAGQSPLCFDTRVHLFAGRRELLIEPGFSMKAEPETLDLASINLEFSGPWTEGRVRTSLNAEGGNSTRAAKAALADHPALLQGGDEVYGCQGSYPARLMDGAGHVLAEGQRAAGWVQVDGPLAPTLVCVPHFWEQFPKGLRCGPKSLVVELWSAQAGGRPFVAHAGAGKSHQVGISLGATPPERWLAPLDARCTPEWYCRSGAFDEIVPRCEGKYSNYEAIVPAAFARMLADRAGYGMENWGDVWQEGYVPKAKTWSNEEWDLANSWVMAYARTGQRRYLDFAHEAARHFADVDCIHAATNPGLVGGSWMHAHTSLRGHQLEPPNFAHAGWVEGLLNVYHLTGDRRGLEAARGIADYICRHAPPTDHHGADGPAYHLPIQRPAGWPLTTLGLVYRETWEPVYLQTSRRIVDYARRIQDPDRGIWDAQVGHEVPYRGGCVFAYTLFRGLRLFYEATGEQRARQDYLHAARWIFGEMWRPGHLYLYEQCPLHEPGTKVPFTLSEMAGYATRISGDPLYAAIGYDALRQHSAGGVKSWMVDSARRSQWANGILQQVPRLLYDWEQTGLSVDDKVTLRAAARSTPVPAGQPVIVRLTLDNKTAAALDDVSAECLIRGDWHARIGACPGRVAAGAVAAVEVSCQSPPRIALYELQNDLAHVHVLVRYRQGGAAKCAWGYARLDVRDLAQSKD